MTPTPEPHRTALGRAAMHAALRRSAPAPEQHLDTSASASADARAWTQVDAALSRWSEVVLRAVGAEVLAGGTSPHDGAAKAALSASSAEGMTSRLARAIGEHALISSAALEALEDLSTSEVRRSLAHLLLMNLRRGFYGKDELDQALAVECALIVAASESKTADLLWDMSARHGRAGMKTPAGPLIRRTRCEFDNAAVKLLPLVLGPANGDPTRTELHLAAGLIFDALLDPTDLDLRRAVRALPPERVAALGQRLDLSVAAIDLLWKASSTEAMALRPVKAPYHGYNLRLNLVRSAKEAAADPALAAALAEPIGPSFVKGSNDAAGVLGVHAGRLRVGLASLRTALERISASEDRKSFAATSLEILDKCFPRRADLYALALGGLFDAQRRSEEDLDHALAVFSGWQDEKLNRADAESWGTAQREASVAAALLGLTLSVTGVSTHPNVPDQVPAEERVKRAMPPFANLVGHKDVAKNAEVRNALISALYNTFAASVVERCRESMLEALAEIVERAKEAAPSAALAQAKETTEALVRLESKIHAQATAFSGALSRVEERLGGGDHVLALVGYLHKQRYFGEKDKTDTIAAALAEGSMSEVRWRSLSTWASPRPSAGNEADSTFDAPVRGWHLGKFDRIGHYEVFDSGEPQHWVEAVNTVRSCLRTDNSPSITRELLQRFVDGRQRVFAARDELHAAKPIRARATGYLQLETKTGQPPRLILSLGPIYPLPQDRHTSRDGARSHPSAAQPADLSPTDALLKYAKSRARALGLEFKDSEPKEREG